MQLLNIVLYGIMVLDNKFVFVGDERNFTDDRIIDA